MPPFAIYLIKQKIEYLIEGKLTNKGKNCNQSHQKQSKIGICTYYCILDC